LKPVRFLTLLLIILMPLVLIGMGFVYYVGKSKYASTDNAYVKANKIVVSAEISGRVVSVLVNENDKVQVGQPLFKLDKEPYLIELEKAEASLARVQQNLKALRGQYRQKQAELRIAKAEVSYHGGELRRQKKLRSNGVTSQVRFDEAKQNFFVARERSNAIKEELSRLLALLGGAFELPKSKHPLVREALANKKIASLNIRRTVIYSPAESIVTNFNLYSGEHVEAGRPVFSLVGTENLWIEANFKETDLTNVAIGQPAAVIVDSYPGLTLTAQVIGISPATGSEFSLLPAQNATGNWVKVVQRLPVRLAIDVTQTPKQLRAGMTVSVKIDTGRTMSLPRFLSPLTLLLSKNP
jgi:membrane fusion protein, multidrug efflux system